MKALTLLFCITLAILLFSSTGLLCYLVVIPATMATMKLMLVSLAGIVVPLIIMLIAS